MEEDMISKQTSRLAILFAVALGGQPLAGCSGSSNGGTGSGGESSGGTTGSGGVTSSGGRSGSGGSTASGGTVGSGGSVGTGGSVATGGSVGTGGSSSGGATATGGSASTGGAPAGGETGGAGGGQVKGSGGVSGAAGGPGTGGRVGAGGAAGGAPGSSGSGGSSSTGMCQKVKAAEVVIMGESFYAIDPKYIQNRIQDDARKAMSLGASDMYRNVAVSGQNMNYIATTEWTAATQGGASVKDVIMDGGGIDCLSGSSCPTCASTFKTLLGKMGTAGVQDVIYTRYPEPGNPPGSNTALKACLDMTMPAMQTTCEGSTSPRCHFLDLRPVWKNGDTTDGLHPTQSGGEHVGDLIWSEMMKDCIAQ
jgi:hypothetical protein